MQNCRVEWTIRDRVILLCIGQGAFGAEDWQRLMADLQASRATGLISVGDGDVTLTPVQRKEVFALLKEFRTDICLVAENRLVRALVALASWFGVPAKAFEWNDLEQAFQFLRVRPDERESMRLELTSLRRRVQANVPRGDDAASSRQRP